MNKTLVIMAAGMGSRYKGLKQIDPVGPDGSLIIDYSIYDAMRAGFNKVVFIIKHEIEEAFCEKIGSRMEKNVEVHYVFQELADIPEMFTVPQGRVKPWGTGQAILCCKDIVKEPFLVINADDFYGKTSFKVMSEWMDTMSSPGTLPMDFAMAGYVLKNTLTENGHVARGVCSVSNGLLDDVIERTKIMRINGETSYTDDEVNWTPVDENSYVSMNMWAFSPDIFPYIESKFNEFLSVSHPDPLKSEILLPQIVRELLEDKKCTVKVIPTEEKWFGVTYKDDKQSVVDSVASKIKAGEYPHSLWA